MLQMDLPHLNVLTKIDNLRNYPNLPFNLDFYTEVQDLNYLLPHLNKEQTSGIPGPNLLASKNDVDDMETDAPTSKFSALNEAIVGLVEDFALVGFETLAVEDKKSMMGLLRAIDRAGGYVFGGVEGANETVWEMAMRQDAVTMDARDVQERWLDRRDEMDAEERKAWEEEARQLAVDNQAGKDTRVTNATEQKPTSERNDVSEDEGEAEAVRKFMKEGGVKVVRKS